MGMAPGGAEVVARGLDIYRVADGRLSSIGATPTSRG